MAVRLSDEIDTTKFLDKQTRDNFDRIKTHRLGRDLDYVVLITADTRVGLYGVGKSVLFHLLCGHMNPERFDLDDVLFDEMDYRFQEPKLIPKDAFGFDEPDAFFSTEAMSRAQRKMKLKFGKIRQKRHFIVICAGTMFDVAKWVRGIGQTKINCVIRIKRRGVFYVYGDKSGALDAIQIDERKRKVKWPASDFIGFFKRIPHKTVWWEAYTRKKNLFLRQADENPRAVKLMKKEHAKMRDTLTLRDIAEIHKVSGSTVRNWYKEGHFGKRGVRIGLDGKIRIKMKSYRAGIKRVLRAREKGLKRRGKRGKGKAKRKADRRTKRKKAKR